LATNLAVGDRVAACYSLGEMLQAFREIATITEGDDTAVVSDRAILRPQAQGAAIIERSLADAAHRASRAWQSCSC